MKVLKNIRRTLIPAMALSLIFPAFQATAQDSFPDQPIQLIVGFSAGGPADTTARTLSQRLGDELGTSIVIVNRPGADGVIAASSVARSKPDGHTLLLAPSTLAINDSLYKELSYDTKKDFAPIAFIGESPNVIGVHPSVPANNVEELVKYAKNNHLFYGSTSSVTLLATEMFLGQTNTKMERVPYKGAGQAIPALLSGEVQVMVSSVQTLLPHVQSDKVHAIAVTSRSRLSNAPDIPTAAEQGLSDYSASTWYGLFAAASTPQAVIEKIAHALKETMKDEAVQESFGKQGMIIHTDIDTPAQFQTYFNNEIEKWKKVVVASDVHLN